VQLTRPAVIQALIVVALIVLSLAVSFTVPVAARADADAWLQNLTPKAQPQLESFTEVQATDIERGRLKDQLGFARERAKHHLKVAIYFFSNYYMAIMQAFVMGAIAVVRKY
jgi:hypothetical protein